MMPGKAISSIVVRKRSFKQYSLIVTIQLDGFAAKNLAGLIKNGKNADRARSVY